MDVAGVVAWQLGRPPRGEWRAVASCSFGWPIVIATAATLEDGRPFPTLYYLTCPHLTAAISSLESAGAADAWHDLLVSDATLARRLEAADTAYRSARAAEGGGVDRTPEVGIAGQRDALATKCLHAHAAAYLAGIDDPVGEGVLVGLNRECTDDRCALAAG
jgi:hypothetical protein